jgi:multimeric flavodoxin WrbA
MFNVSAQLKLFLDRTYAVPEAIRSKPVGILLTYADEDEIISGAVYAMNSLRDLCAYRGAMLTGIVHASASDAGEVTNNVRAMDEAFALGSALITREK